MENLTQSDGLNLIVVEDNADLCGGWEDILSLDGHHVQSYRNAFELFNNLSEIEKCDLLISDYYLPDLNGLQLIDKIRKIRPEIPVIMITGSKEPEIQVGVDQLGNSLLLHKPLGIEELEEGMKKLQILS